MPDDPLRPSWLDEERAKSVEVYAAVIHPACLCRWKRNDEMFKLAERKRLCVIHGVRGHV